MCYMDLGVIQIHLGSLWALPKLPFTYISVIISSAPIVYVYETAVRFT